MGLRGDYESDKIELMPFVGAYCHGSNVSFRVYNCS